MASTQYYVPLENVTTVIVSLVITVGKWKMAMCRIMSGKNDFDAGKMI